MYLLKILFKNLDQACPPARRTWQRNCSQAEGRQVPDDRRPDGFNGVSTAFLLSPAALCLSSFLPFFSPGFESVSLKFSHSWFFITALWLDRMWGSYRNIVTHTGEGTLQSSLLLYCCSEDSTITTHRCLKMPFGDFFMSCYHLLMSVGLLPHLLRGIRIKDPVIHGQSASGWPIISGLSGEPQLN